jgi:hypothetical protein
MRKGYLLLAESYDRLAKEAKPSPDEPEDGQALAESS